MNGSSDHDGRQVVIIDDNVDGAEALAMLLEIEGYRVQCAHDGRAGLALIEAASPDVVLCDIGLPVLDGYGVAQALRASPAHGPRPLLIAVTGLAQPEDQRRALEAGFQHHMVKPVDPMLLLSSHSSTTL